MDHLQTVGIDEDALAMVDDGLTMRQRLFVLYFCGEARSCATKAARMAGYTGDDHTLASTGYRLLRVPPVMAGIAERFTALSMTQAEVTMQLTGVGRMTLAEAAQEIKAASNGQPAIVKLDLGPKVKALEVLARTYGMIVEKHRTEQTGEVKITIHHKRKPIEAGGERPPVYTIDGTAREIECCPGGARGR